MSYSKFRPSEINTKFVLKMRLKCGRTVSYNQHSRNEWYPVGYGLNKRTIFKQFGKLHYLACHAPAPVQKKWKKAYNNFHDQHFGSCYASVRYLNNWSCHNWL